MDPKFPRDNLGAEQASEAARRSGERHPLEEWSTGMGTPVEDLDTLDTLDTGNLPDQKSKHKEDELQTPGAPSGQPLPPLSWSELALATLSKLKDYDDFQRIGSGGMGVVYKARQISLNRTVAIKTILAGPLARESDIKRFRVEAESAANLRHPNIVAIHEVGVLEGQPYLTMDYIEGESLSAVVRRELPPATQAARLLQTIAQAIQFAHQQGVLHRDLKPSNVLIDRAGQPFVMDFGLAKRLPRDEAPGEGVLDEGELTATGEILGTPNYMPPEQAGGRRGEIGPRSDVYSLGAMLYELLTGRPPFLAESALDTLSQVLNAEPVSLRLLNPNLSRDLETICLKCLEKEPLRRYSSAAALAEELGRYLKGEPISARPVSSTERAWRWCRRNPRVAGLLGTITALLLLIALGSTGFAVWIGAERNRTEREYQRAQANFLEAEKNFETALEAVDRMLLRVGDEELKNVPQMDLIRRELMNDALEFHQRFLNERGQEATVQFRSAEAYRHVGWIQHRLGEYDEAEAAYRQCLALLQNLEPRFSNVSCRSALALCESKLALVLKDTGRFDEAEAACEAAVERQQQLHAEFPHVADFSRDLASAYNDHASLLTELGRNEEARQIYYRAIDLLGKPTVESPAFHRQLAYSYNDLAMVLQDLGESEEARTALRAATTLKEQLLSEADTFENRSSLAKSYNNLGILLVDAKRHAEAEQIYTKALALKQQTASSFPDVAPYQNDLAHTMHNLGKVQDVLGHRNEAEAQYRAAIQIGRKLVEEAFDVPKYRSDLAGTCRALGSLLRSERKNEEAERMLREAIELQEGLCSQYVNVPEYRFALADSYHDIAQMLPGDAQGSEQAIRQAIKLREALMEQSPSEAKYQEALASSYDVLYKILRASGSDEAEQALRKAIPLREDLIRQFPERLDCWHDLAGSYYNLANLIRKDQTELGENAYRQAIAIRRRLCEEQPDNEAYANELAATYNNLASHLRDASPQDAADLFEQAIMLREQLVQAHPRHRMYRSALADSHINLARLLATRADASKAEHSHRRAIELRESLVNDYPDDARTQQHLANDWALLGVLLHENNRPDEAERAYQNAVGICEQLVVKLPSEHAFRSTLGAMLNDYADLYVLRGQELEQARGLLERAREQQEKALELSPGNEHYRARLADHWKSWCLLQYRLGDWQGAIDSAGKSAEYPSFRDGAVLLAVAMAYRRQGDKERSQQWHDRALQWIEQNGAKDKQLLELLEEADSLLPAKSDQ